MDEREELKQELEREIQWVKYRQKILTIIEMKLMQMNELVNRAKQENCTKEELKALNDKINNLAAQVRALDSESRIIEEGKILE